MVTFGILWTATNIAVSFWWCRRTSRRITALEAGEADTIVKYPKAVG